MNLMLTAAGYPWTVIPVSGTYMAALETASVGRDVKGRGGTIHEKCYFM